MKRAFLFTVMVAALAYLFPLPGQGASVSDRLDEKRRTVRKSKAREGILTEELIGDRNRLISVRAQLAQTRTRLQRAQSELDQGRRRLLTVRNRAQVARDRLVRLRARLATSRKALARRLVTIYKSDRPDVLTVVLSSKGFDDLLDRTEFLERIANRDAEVLASTRRLKRGVEAEARRLEGLEREAQRTAQGLLARRDDIAGAKDQLASHATRLTQARARRQRTLARVRGLRSRAQEDVTSLERQQAEVIQRLQARRGGIAAAPPAGGGGGRLAWPLRGTITSPFGGRWGRLHAGLDISVPEGTPIRAAASGRVALAAPTGGYGNYTCLQHSGGLSTCYAHQSRFAVSSGRSVSQGQVIGFSGNTGNSTGPHLHFETRSGGQPVNPLGYL